jgi:hypothetical protein
MKLKAERGYQKPEALGARKNQRLINNHSE